MKGKELATATSQELSQMLMQQQAELRTFQSQLASNQLSNVRAVRKVRKQIARIQTFLSKKKVTPTTVV
ncbi:MAG: 50S ribosomal protein L29 [Candidatus Uhrbacteria bacterium GW2011_GWF2_41_16]|jgi:large subunit ribosomal protein L29|uniref:Large ribosomal subunit protein uL29 n=2 Tax=Candidatus Uhriibacteriota TaxID=1752732 RepID=A0A0G0VFT1_9BACT|nr:MAG: 50S ribosomal protein L29 [Candidatus Uhrbacteria bacterium GW2011_GWA2_41_10]KKR87526.1 MAG: 50S ribosomal protein L29 [Candidatus Uhrbacteria bacterium GW2011_GWC2_41_11]KKR98506.1 MAG: 50S ribosomal protein L29 [Candidatus Uhrbacteria bacterium GW2011_GWF2_41_16]HBO99958.1 50S ribosomal protein L29 [Candidatus Uhrbacteria bacterium]